MDPVNNSTDLSRRSFEEPIVNCPLNSSFVYLSGCTTSMESGSFIHKWRIAQFAVQQELMAYGEYLESNTFGSDGGEYKFKLKLFPCGKDVECRGYISLFLQIIRCPTSKLRFRVNFYVEGIDGPRGCALNKNVVTINRGGIVTASKFFSIDTLKSKPSRFLPDDTLTVGVELTVFGDQTNTDECFDDFYSFSEHQLSTKPFNSIPGDSSLGRDFGCLRENSDLTDFTIHVGRKSYKCHKAILAARSPFFRAMFRNVGNQENITGEVTLGEITCEVMETVLDYIYRDCWDVAGNAVEILAAADRFCLDRLKGACEAVLARDIDVSNVCSRIRLAELYNATRIKKMGLQVIVRNRQTVLHSQEWLELEEENPALATWVLRRLIHFPDSIRSSTFTTCREQPSPVKRPRIS